MNYEIECKNCGANFATIRLVSTRSFMNSCHATMYEVLTLNPKLEVMERDDYRPLYKVRCYNCGQLHTIYQRREKYECRRITKRKKGV